MMKAIIADVYLGGWILLLFSVLTLAGCEPSAAPGSELQLNRAGLSSVSVPGKTKTQCLIEMVDLGSLDNTGWAQASSINNKGQIVGFSTTSAPEAFFHAFVWEDGTMTDLGIPAWYNIALSINEPGQIVGMYLERQDAAWLWENGEMKNLGTLGWLGTTASSINNKGQIVGYSHTHPSVGNHKHAFLWEQGTMTDLGTLGGTYSEAISINNRGQIIGHSTTSSGEMRSFLLEKGTMQNLGDFEVAALNDKGEMAGYIPGPAGERHIAIRKNGRTEDLGPFSLGGDSDDTVISAITNNGMMVGAGTTSTGETHAFLWDKGSMIDLGTLGGDWSEASSINNKGQVVGFSLTSTGDRHAVLWNINSAHNKKNEVIAP